MIVIKINWKARLKNKAFLISFIALVISFVYKILSLFGAVPNFTEGELLDLVTVILNALALMGIIVDPTTSGLGDSQRALAYYKNETTLKGEENG